ncbi:myeloid leukemia factor 1-like [Styela clava]
MFGRSLMREFEDDPFFSGYNSHRDIFDSMGRFPDPFMAISDGRKDERKGRHQSKDRDNQDRQVDPFGGIFHSMNNMMSEMHKRMADMQVNVDSGDPNVHSFTSSHVMSYRNDGKSEPKYYQASTSTRRAPGQIKETRRTLRDSESGIEKMSIGHHLGERGKVIERRRNIKKGGALEEEKNYFHMGEEDEHDFDRDWKHKTSTYNMDYGRSKNAVGRAKHESKGLGPAPAEPTKKRVIKTPAAAAAPRGLEAPRPHGPSKSGRTRSKY